MAQHGAMFVRVPVVVRASFTKKAESAEAARAEESRIERARLQARLQLLERRRKKELRFCGVPNHFEACKFTETDIERMCNDFTDGISDANLLSLLRASSPQATAAPSSEEMRVPKPTCPWWVAVVAAHRDRFRFCGFTCDEDRFENMLLLLYASQSPYGAVFMKLRRKPTTRVCDVDWSELGEVHLLRLSYSFALLECVCEGSVGFSDGDNIFVIPSMQFGAGGAFTDSDCIPFEYFVRLFPMAKAKGGNSANKPQAHVSSDLRAAMLQEYPWLTEEDIPVRVRRFCQTQAVVISGAAWVQPRLRRGLPTKRGSRRSSARQRATSLKPSMSPRSLGVSRRCTTTIMPRSCCSTLGHSGAIGQLPTKGWCPTVGHATPKAGHPGSFVLYILPLRKASRAERCSTASRRQARSHKRRPAFFELG